MGRGPKKHLKRLAAPKHWMLDKLSGTWAPRPSPGPHKRNECLPLLLLLRNRLKYALTGREVTTILTKRMVKVDGKIRTDPKYPAGLMDVIEIPTTGEYFRLVYDVKGRFKVHRIKKEEASYKLCKVRKTYVANHGVPYATTYDGRTFRFPDPNVKANDTIRVDIESNKILAHASFVPGNIAIVTNGRNVGRVGKIIRHEKHNGGFDIVHIVDSHDHKFATRALNVFVLGEGNQPWISLPKDSGVKLTVAEERDRRIAREERVRRATSYDDE